MRLRLRPVVSGGAQRGVRIYGPRQLVDAPVRTDSNCQAVAADYCAHQAEVAGSGPDCRPRGLSLYDWSQNAARIWQGSNTAVRREILDSVCLNRTLSDVKLVTTKRNRSTFSPNGLKMVLVGVTGFEPATSWSQTKRSSQAELRPEGVMTILLYPP